MIIFILSQLLPNIIKSYVCFINNLLVAIRIIIIIISSSSSSSTCSSIIVL